MLSVGLDKGAPTQTFLPLYPAGVTGEAVYLGIIHLQASGVVTRHDNIVCDVN